MLHRILDQLGDLIFLATISFVFGLIKVLTVPEPDCFLCRVNTLLISTLVGTLAGALALQYQLGDYTSLTISSIASLLSRDLVVALLNNRKYIGDLFRKALSNLVDKFTK